MPRNHIIRFLLVDDVDANLLALEGLLKRPGLELLKAHSGAEALELLLAYDIALAFLDVQMPEVDGFELARLMRGSDRTRHIPIIFLTAGAVDQQRRFDGYDAGAVDFLFKPIEPHILQSKANIFFNVAQQREELRENEKRFREANAKLTQTVTELQNARRAALNVMEEAVQSRAAAEKLNIALRESEERLRLLVEGSPNAMVMVNDAGAITLVNSQTEKIFGYTRDELLGRPVEILVPERYRIHHPALRSGFLHAPTARPMGAGRELFAARKDGAEVAVEIGISPLQIGERTFVLATITDISQRKQAEEALRLAQAQLADRAGQLEQAVAERTAKLRETIGELEGFSYSITHDLRAPLRALQSFSGLLLEGYSEKMDDAGKDFLRRIATSASRMDKLIQDVLTYSQVLRTELRLEPVEVTNLLRGMLDSYPEFQEPKADVAIEGELPAVLGNEAALTQCFSNLLNNAVKFVPPETKPRVRIWAEERIGGLVDEGMNKGERPASQQSNNPAIQSSSPPRWVRFWVADNGIGIAQRHLETIFGMFQRLDTAYEGTGVGLPIVRKAVERMGGKAGVESEPGKGSRFWLDLNVADTESGNS